MKPDEITDRYVAIISALARIDALIIVKIVVDNDFLLNSIKKNVNLLVIWAKILSL